MTVSRYETRAEKLLADLGVVDPPVDVEHVARHCGAIIATERFRRDLSGMLIRDGADNQPVIGVNSTHHPRRQRFTIAHEIGHLLLHNGRALTVDSGLRVDYRADDGSPSIREEREANAFAAALLMPSAAVERAAHPLLQTGTARAVLISRLAHDFQVSEEAMGYRLLNLGFSAY